MKYLILFFSLILLTLPTSSSIITPSLTPTSNYQSDQYGYCWGDYHLLKKSLEFNEKVCQISNAIMNDNNTVFVSFQTNGGQCGNNDTIWLYALSLEGT